MQEGNLVHRFRNNYATHLSATEIKIEPFSFLRDPLIFLKKISEYQVSICGGTTPSGLDLLIQICLYYPFPI